MKNNFLIQYIWIIIIAIILFGGGLMLQGCTFTHISEEEKQIQKEWEAIDKEREKNDNNQ